jgi:hypothetical protein
MEDQKALEVVAPREAAPANLMQYALQVRQVVEQRALIKSVMSEIMVENTHYGVIPGTDKPTLYLAGAETLCTVFRFAPDFEIDERVLPNGHIQVRATCTLTHIPTGQILARLSGSCSTMEGKYRFRDDEAISTGERIPKEYWNLKNSGKEKEAFELIGGKGFKPLKTDEGYFIARKTGLKVENPTPEDLHNTVLKMAEKRAFVGAVRLATGASDIFTLNDPGPGDPQTRREEVAKRNRAAGAINKEDLARIIEGMETLPELTTYFNEHPKQFKTSENMALFVSRRDELKNAAKSTKQKKEISCPNIEGRMAPIENCDKCASREGCPEHQEGK